ncbi:hypothetical protein NDU88_007859 [Pleurodeles waltl]|uniref:Uncharacterized protein n=1 Tax=Pleurodeles waltl TaxID=8319 RepID=A0AAV7STX2_PLEWA|nr:hypothetical protein NDU88_007859 [Pleurodeles waltl]
MIAHLICATGDWSPRCLIWSRQLALVRAAWSAGPRLIGEGPGGAARPARPACAPPPGLGAWLAGRRMECGAFWRGAFQPPCFGFIGGRFGLRPEGSLGTGAPTVQSASTAGAGGRKCWGLVFLWC